MEVNKRSFTQAVVCSLPHTESGSRGNRVLERSSWSESMFVGEGCGGESSGGLSTPLSEPPPDSTSSLLYSSLDLQSNAAPDHEGSAPTTADSNLTSDPLAQATGPAALPSDSTQDMECQAGVERSEHDSAAAGENRDDKSEATKPSAAEVRTLDVDLLLECTFSYMQASEEPEKEPEPMEETSSVFTDPADNVTSSSDPADRQHTGTLDLELPIRPLGYSPSPEPSPSPSSDEEDIYGHGMPASASSDRLRDGLDALHLQGTKQQAQEEARLHKDQVRHYL